MRTRKTTPAKNQPLPPTPGKKRTRTVKKHNSKTSKLPIIDSDSIPRLGYKVPAAAQVLGLDPSTTYDLVRSGKIRYARLAGGTIIIGLDAIKEFLRGENAA